MKIDTKVTNPTGELTRGGGDPITTPITQARPIHRFGCSSSPLIIVMALRTNRVRNETLKRPSAALAHAHTAESERAK